MGIVDRLYHRFFLGRRDLLLLWIGQLASGFGDSLASIGFLFLILDLTGSERKVGTFQMVAYIPIVLFGLVAGVYVDRRDRKRVMLIADGGRALALALLPVAAMTGNLGVAWAGGTVMVVTTLTTFFNPAYNSALPIIVDDPAKLFGVNAVMQSSRQFAAIAGPIFAAIGVGQRGPVALLSVNAITYLVSFLSISTIRTKLATGNPARIRFAELRQDAMVGLRTVMGNRSVRWVFLVSLMNNLLLMGPAIVGTPLLVKKVFHGSLGDFALIELMYALGMTVTGLLLHRLPPIKKVGRLWAIGLTFDGFTFVLYLLAGDLTMLNIATFIHALAIPLIIVSRATIIQRLVQRELLGRAFGYIDIAVYGVTALSAGITGFVSAAIGPLLTIVCGGVLAGICGLCALMLKPVQRIVFDDDAEALPAIETGG
ncbi:MAG: MFS transporter [Bacteroidota bacterium]